MSRATFGLAVAAAAALALTACSPGAPGEVSGDLDPAKSPLAEYFDALYGGFDEDDWAAQQLVVEQKVAECMAAEGFEYIPVDYSSQPSYVSDDSWDPESEEWVAQYGYGFVNYPMGEEFIPDEGEEFQDPNQDYVESLSEAEMNAYYEALYGPSPDPDEEFDENTVWEPSGCYAEAQDQEFDDPFQNPQHEPLMEALMSLYEGLERNPRLAELNAQWASCMADAGHPGFAQQYDAQMSIMEELNEFYESGTEFDPNSPRLKELGEREIELALADLKCAKSVNYTQEMLKVQFELERQFISDHKAELDALLADMEQGR